MLNFSADYNKTSARLSFRKLEGIESVEVEEQIKHSLSAKHKSLEDVQAILLAKVRQISGTVTTRGARFHPKISESSSNNDESHLKWVSFEHKRVGIDIFSDLIMKTAIFLGTILAILCGLKPPLVINQSVKYVDAAVKLKIANFSSLP